MASTLEHRGHLVIIFKERGQDRYKYVLQNIERGKVCKTTEFENSTLPQVKNAAKSWIDEILKSKN